MAAFENNFSTLCFFDGLCRFLSVPGNRLPLSGWSSENLMLLFVTAGAYFSISTLFLLCSGSRLLPMPLTSLLDSVSVGSSSQRTRESPCSAGKHCQHCSSRQSSQRVTQPALCCGFVLNYSNSPLSQGSGQQTSSALSHLGYFTSLSQKAGSMGRRCCVLPALAVSFGIEAGCQPRPQGQRCCLARDSAAGGCSGMEPKNSWKAWGIGCFASC